MKLRYLLIILLFIVLSVAKVFGQKQSLYELYPSLVHKDVMNTEYDTRFMGGTPTAITYSYGKATFNGSTSNITYRSVNGVKAVRLKLTLSTTTQAVLTLSATHSISVTSGTISATGFASPTIYVNGAVSSTITTAESEIVVTTATAINANTIILGKVSTSYLTGSVNEFDLYTRAISTSEIYNMYLGVHHKDLELTPLINFDSRAGQIVDKRGNTITNTATTIKRSGSIFSADFNGSTSKLDYGNIDALTGDITIVGWVKARGYGEGNLGRILDNGKVFLNTNLTQKAFTFSRDNATNPQSATNSVLLNKWYFVCVTSTSSGITNFYIGDYKTSPIISHTANQAGGTPATGSNIYIGNRSADDRTFNGLIPQIRIYKSILTQADFTRIWSNSLNSGVYYGD